MLSKTPSKAVWYELVRCDEISVGGARPFTQFEGTLAECEHRASEVFAENGEHPGYYLSKVVRVPMQKWTKKMPEPPANIVKTPLK